MIVSKTINLIGNHYGRLTVIARAGSKIIGIKQQRKEPCWLCQCSCGKKTIATSQNLRCGDTRSCGCLSHELKSQRMKNDPRMKHIEDFLDENRHLKPEYQKNHHPTKDTKLRISNSSGITGVSYEIRNGKATWVAKLYYHGKYVLNRRFKSKHEAIAARVAAEQKYLQQFLPSNKKFRE